MEKPIGVLVVGGFGKMGKEVVNMVQNSGDLELVSIVDTAHNCDYSLPSNIFVGHDLKAAIKESKPQVVVDFTHPGIVLDNTLIALKERAAVVVGTTGLKPEALDQIHVSAEEKGIGVVVAPNFALGAVLMMEISKQIAKHFSEVEIIEMHNPKKADSPSGTALKTAEGIARNLKSTPVIYDSSPARGEIINNIPIHSVRLTGLIAHQQVIFGAQGQTLTIKHDSYDRTSFMPGVALAIKKVMKCKGLIYGLENLLEL
ncbi:4-hydroxy-tetrahydrodipicolinate reductase [Desulfitibacter alkalitolerans]|uniref:4-hydroxy-tetrahydrodipicolinate reductase n=1 Tax=Desulfitibacter alkalitolerans TaxID=264641 RepID=UPI00047F438D|nr:4-hydroxy-tetrahydrodipicolinate reductase [Desulfitibacter alkalitolerans]